MLNNDSIGKVILGIAVHTLINILFLFGLVEGFTYSYHFSYKLFADIPYVAASSNTMHITIDDGLDARQVAKILDANGLVDGEYLILARMYLGKYNSRIQSGTYTLSPGMTPDEICRCICGMQVEDET